jgi:inhibitor of cysteine peptidase
MNKFFLITGLVTVLLLSACSLPNNDNINDTPPRTDIDNDDRDAQPSNNNLALVDEVEVEVMESLPLQASARVSGNLRNGCEQLGEASVRRFENTFTVTLPVNVVGEMCTQALIPFTKNISLDIEGLPAGTYQVSVNGVSDSFVLDSNN